MFRHIRGPRRKIIRFIFKTTFYGSIGLGLFPFVLNSRFHQLQRSNWLMAYGVILNFALIGLIVNVEDNENDLKKDVFDRNPMVKYIMTLVGVISLSTACVTHLTTCWRSKDLARILNELLHLQQKYFRNFRVDDCPKFDYYVIQKFLTIIFELLSSLFLHFLIPGSHKFKVDAFYTYVVQLGVLLKAMHYHLYVIYIYRFVWIVNRQLLHLANQLRMGRRVDSTRIQSLLWLYSRLLDLNSRLTDIYDYQITLTMVTVLSANIVIAFVIIVFSVGIQKLSITIMVIMFPQALIINFWDFWISVAICDLAERTGRQTSNILRLFNDMQDLDVDVERTLSEFAWFCSQQQLKFFHCRMFYVNYQTGFHMVITSILYLLFIVQFDYMNLIK